MQYDAGSKNKQKKIHRILNPTALTNGNKMQKTLEVKKQKKNPSETKPEGLKPKAIKCKKTLEAKKPTKIHRILNPTAFTKGNKMQKDAWSQKTEKNPSEPKPEGLKPKAIKCKKTLEVKKQKEIHRSLNPTDLKQRQ